MSKPQISDVLPYGIDLQMFYDDLCGNVFIAPIRYEHVRSCDANATIVGCRPILYPICDLTNEIYVNGEHFIPVLKLIDRCIFGQHLSSERQGMLCDDGWTLDEFLDLVADDKVIEAIDMLSLWKIDCRNLIGASKAVNVHILKDNPYKTE